MIPPVTHLVISLDTGGLERLVVDWTNERNRRWPGSTRIVCLDEPGALAGQVEGNVLTCAAADRSRFPWDRQAVRAIRGDSARIIHSHNLAAQQYAVLACRGRRTEHVHTRHGVNVHNLRWRDRVRSRILAERTDVVVAVSEALARTMADTQDIPREHIRIVPNGIDVDRFSGIEDAARGQARSRWGLEPDAFVFGSVGRLAHVKGYDRLLQAMASLTRGHHASNGAESSNHPMIQSSCPPQLLLVGDGPERAALEAQADAADVSAHVIFAGVMDDPRPALAAMDAFILPSRSEGVPVALLEAMAAGVPVLVTSAGACGEIVAQGACGVVLPDDDTAWPGVLAAQMTDGARQGAAERASAGRERVRDHYSLDATLDAYEGIYSTFL